MRVYTETVQIFMKETYCYLNQRGLVSEVSILE